MVSVGWVARAAIAAGLALSAAAIGSVLVDEPERRPVELAVAPALAPPTAARLPLTAAAGDAAAAPAPARAKSRGLVAAAEAAPPIAPRDAIQHAAPEPAAPPPAQPQQASMTVAQPEPAPPREPVEKVVEVGRGDTLLKLLVAEGVERREAFEAVDALQDLFDPRRLKVGQRVTLAVQSADAGNPSLHRVSIEPEPGRTVFSARQDDGAFAAGEIERPLQARLDRFSGTITSSLFEAAQSAGLPVNTLIGMIRAYSYDVDFQRDIQPGDRFEVALERMYDENGEWVRDGDMVFARLTLSGSDMPIYRWTDPSGEVDYYNDRGQSVRKALLRTPVDGFRISSRYGKRRHPILGYNKMHKGIDFAAPTGTPIMAAGDGVVEKAGPWGGYGNYVRIRHSDRYATAYAHLSRFAKNVRAGTRVKQGQIVGYVGSTGRSTGPHLHYEILVEGNQVNPLSVKFEPGRTLKGQELEQFRTARVEVDRKVADLPNSAAVASAATSAGRQ